LNIRQQKIARQIQKDFSVIMDKFVRETISRNVLVTIIEVYITADLSIAKLYLGFMGTNEKEEILAKIKVGIPELRNLYARGPGKSMKKLPEFQFYIDQSLDKVDRINDLLKDH
jgi:ribosome-binding factor A